jgi:hypothetical protein
MIDRVQLERAAYAIFETHLAQQRVPGPTTNMSINHFWVDEWARTRDQYRAQALAAFTAAGLEIEE